MIKKLVFIMLAAALISSCSYGNRNTIPVIFDTDLGNDIDDVLALQMLLNYDRDDIIDLKAVTVSKNNVHSIEFVDGYCRYNGHSDIPVGFAYDGVTPDDYYYLVPTLSAEVNGHRLLVPQINPDSVEEGFRVIRKRLVEAEDNSVVLIAVGPLTNIGRLLDSGADDISSLTGVELMKKKVKLLSVMAGMFDTENMFPEYNVVCDIPAARTVFEKCPVRLVVSGWELGNKLLYPHTSILNDFGDAGKHPLAIAYCNYMKMPYDRQTWDLTSVMAGGEPENGILRYSEPGRIAIDENGYSIFTADSDGNHCYLILDDANHNVALEALVRQVTGKQM